MAVCSYCGNVVDRECPRCKSPDHLVERKYNKHSGGQPVSRHRADPAVKNPKPHVWPKFKPGTKAPGTPEPVV